MAGWLPRGGLRAWGATPGWNAGKRGWCQRLEDHVCKSVRMLPSSKACGWTGRSCSSQRSVPTSAVGQWGALQGV